MAQLSAMSMLSVMIWKWKDVCLVYEKAREREVREKIFLEIGKRRRKGAGGEIE